MAIILIEVCPVPERIQLSFPEKLPANKLLAHGLASFLQDAP